MGSACVFSMETRRFGAHPATSAGARGARTRWGQEAWPVLAFEGRSAAPYARLSAKDVVELRSVTKTYGNVRALRGVSARFEAGVVTMVLGPNGSGKSTLLRLVAALATPSGGTIRVGGADLATLDDAAFRAKVAFLPQEPFLPDSATVREALAMLATSGGAATDDAMQEALRRVEVLGALESARPEAPLDVPVAALSVGQRKRVALARLLLRRADIVLLDEPDANLDAAGIVMLGRVLRDLAKTSAVAVAAHSRALAAEGGVDVELAA